MLEEQQHETAWEDEHFGYSSIDWLAHANQR